MNKQSRFAYKSISTSPYTNVQIQYSSSYTLLKFISIQNNNIIVKGADDVLFMYSYFYYIAFFNYLVYVSLSCLLL